MYFGDFLRVGTRIELGEFITLRENCTIQKVRSLFCQVMLGIIESCKAQSVGCANNSVLNFREIMHTYNQCSCNASMKVYLVSYNVLTYRLFTGQTRLQKRYVHVIVARVIKKNIKW